MDWKRIISGLFVGAVLGIASTSYIFQGRISKLEAKLDLSNSEKIPLQGSNESKEESCNDYGIKISDAKPNQADKEKLNVYGTYKSKPKKENIYLFVVDPNGQEYWPQNLVDFNTMNNTWSSKVHFSPDTYIIAAIVGEAGVALVDYYYKVGNTNKTKWIGINRLTNDIIECDRKSLK